MLYFENDYSEGAHEKVLKHLIRYQYGAVVRLRP